MVKRAVIIMGSDQQSASASLANQLRQQNGLLRLFTERVSRAHP